MLVIVSHILFVSLSREQPQLFYKIWGGSAEKALVGLSLCANSWQLSGIQGSFQGLIATTNRVAEVV